MSRGYVIFDDWKIPQARAAAVVYRIKNGINSQIFGSGLRQSPPFWTIDRMAFWRKEANESDVASVANSTASIDEQVGAWAVKRLKLRRGLQRLKSGICFTHGTLLGPTRAAESAAGIVDCYRACEREPTCAYMTWRRLEKATRCKLHSTYAMPVLEEAARFRSGGGKANGHAGEQCISGVVARGVSVTEFSRNKAERRARRLAKEEA